MPALLVDFDGVLMATPQTTNPFAESLTWNLGEFCRRMRYSVNCDAPLTWISAGLLPLLPAFWSHQDCELPTLGSPPWPSMTPSPTMPDPVPVTAISDVAEP